MKYVCLVHFAPEALSSLNEEEKRALDARSIAYNEELVAGGHLIAAEALQSPDSAVLVKVRGGKVSTTDGPFAETKEQLGGFILIEARDLNEAIRVASGIPLAALGTIEVRPIYEIPTPERGGP
ncbi:YciI family protein [Sorangium sp. So ce1097]|uniref:YciI family protein n=1 Tax=Sorangium sp. So ce1097 TaxID=3133330 RepID=UPI003F629EEA